MTESTRPKSREFQFYVTSQVREREGGGGERERVWLRHFYCLQCMTGISWSYLLSKAANNQYACKQYAPLILQLYMLLTSNVLLLDDGLPKYP